MPHHSSESSPVAYSFTRFSDPEQGKGDSLRRQTVATAEWCERNGFQLDTTLTLHHVGSAYRGKHRDDKFALGQFLKLAERRRVPKGSYLIIENLDRLSREEERPALRLWMDILDAGINIVQLVPETIFRHEKSDMVDIMRAIIELSRGHSESRMKSERVGKAWSERKRRARESSETLTQNLPGWIEIRGGKRCIKPGAKAIIKRIFRLATQGYGEVRIMRLFTAEGVPSFGTSGRWTKPYLHSLLKDRRLLGELQPTLLTTGEPDGPVIPAYFPVVISEAEFYAAQRGREKRKAVRRDATPVELQTIDELHEQKLTVAEISRKLGISRQSIYRALVRLGKRKKPTEQKPRPVYLFGGGLVSECGSQRRYNLATWRNGDGYGKSLVLDGGAKSISYVIFERAILHLLAELNPKEILEGANGHDDVTALEGEYDAVDAELRAMNDDMDANGFSQTIAKRVRAAETRLAEISHQLTAARQKAANPLSGTWAEFQSLAHIVQKARANGDTDTLLRLHGALRRIIESIQLLIERRGQHRLAAVQIWFSGSERHREYLIIHQVAMGNAHRRREAKCWAGAINSETWKTELDLRKRDYAQAMATWLEAQDIQLLMESLPEIHTAEERQSP